MPEYWVPDENADAKVTVPISMAVKIIKGLGYGSQINTNNGISIFRRYDGFKLIVPASKARGGDVYLNKDILDLVDRNIFEKVSDRMSASVPEANMDALIEVLQNSFSASVTLSAFQFEMIKGEIAQRKAGNRQFPPLKTLPKPKANRNIIQMMEMEALALELELELLNFAA